MRETHGPVFSLNLVATTFNLFISPAHQATFWRVSDDDFSLNQIFIDRCGPLWNPDATAETVALLMKQLTLAFNRSSRLQAFCRAATPVIHNIVKDAYAGQRVDLFEMASSLAIRVSLRVFFGKRFHDAHADRAMVLVRQLEKDIMSPINSIFPGWPLPPNRRMAQFTATMKAWLDEEIQHRLAARSAAAHDAKIGAVDGTSDAEPDDYLEVSYAIVMHFATILLAAHTNTAGTIGWTAFHLARDPALQDDVRQQLAAEASAGVDPTGTTDLFSSCIRETGRRYSSLFKVRKAVRDTEFDGYFIPKDQLLAISSACNALDPASFGSPLEYDPRRWMDGRTDGIANGREVAQFGFGKHKCLGERLALMTFRQIVFPALLAEHRLELVDPDASVEPNYFKTMGTPFSAEPVLVNVSRL
ncbi:cytochrome P450 [Entophlyctis helioformis]|nr:cytochrome P450 [Entophlyctis helioformis]